MSQEDEFNVNSCVRWTGETLQDGDEGGQDSGYHRGRIHCVLDAVLHDVRGAGLLSAVHPFRAVLDPLLAGLLQLSHQPVHLRPLQPRLSLRLPEDPMQVSVFQKVARATWPPEQQSRRPTSGHLLLRGQRVRQRALGIQLNYSRLSLPTNTFSFD